MKDSSFRKADAFIGSQSRDLGSLFAKIRSLAALNQKISGYLAPEIAPYCQAANLTGGKLIFTVANGSIATRLRFMSADLLRQFSCDPGLKHIRLIECKVRLTSSSAAPRPSAAGTRNMPLLARETAELVREMAESITDPKLRAIMERIANRTDTKTA
ncbi:hypothetical protein AQUSIP_16460 [Aquicella siphonis]|uniref:DUF721 domain-containing protein n=2 Tax=Aquicella siphonis TaxID=254247 RepID=A0A5E4PID4_9COXI|nr:hypothetical protein AQUSIP_16460 [Aquicella siphonis]